MKNSEDLMRIAKVVGSLIDHAAFEVFASHALELLSKPITYIVPAVWGAKKEGELTDSQKEINHKVAPIIDQIIRMFEFQETNGAQEFAVGYIVRGLFVSKILYMIERMKNQQISKGDSAYDEQKENNPLDWTDPIGRA